MSTESDSAASTQPGKEGGRPLAVYGVLVAGVATLLVLLAIIYWSSGDRDKPEQPTCTNMTADETINAIYREEVQSLTINYDAIGDPATGERYGPVLAKVDLVNGQCGNLPQGVENLNQIYEVVGVIHFYNDTTERSQIEIKKEQADWLLDSLYWTPTAIPTETPLPTETPVATESPEATVEPTAEPTAAPTEVASPEAEGSPDAEGTPVSDASPAS